MVNIAAIKIATILRNAVVFFLMLIFSLKRVTVTPTQYTLKGEIYQLSAKNAHF
jgi:hypothetical protein